jgi:LSD1 subclass zinc finger protein
MMTTSSQECPNCGQNEGLFVADDRRLTCWNCGYKSEDMQEDTSFDAPDSRKRWQISYSTLYTPEIDRWAETKFYSGMDYLRHEKYDEAIESFKQAIEQQHDFIEAHLWIARMSLDPKEKHEHYEFVHAYVPNHLETTRELMVLNGQLTREEADRSLNSDEQTVVEVEQAVSTKLEELVCSSCGGALAVTEGASEVYCQFCGHIEKIAVGSYGMQSLTMALLKEHGKVTHWKVGKYLLHCDNCGAERVITSRKMTQRCPFCSSDHVVRSDALDSFRQPDGIVPFVIKRQQAEAALNESLNSVTEKFKGLFVNNRVDKVSLTPVYLPYWVFDLTAQVTRTRIDNRSKRSFLEAQASNSQEQFGDALNNVPYCAVESLPRKLVDRMAAFDFSEVKPYSPKLLANITAQLYSVDFQQASLDVREEIGERVRFRHGHDPHGDVQIRVTHMIQQMSFRLIMLPVWIANIVEDDGDLRLAIIQGQKGHVLLGKTHKPDA